MVTLHQAAVGRDGDGVPDGMAVQNPQRGRVDGPAIVLRRVAGILHPHVALLRQAVYTTFPAHNVRHLDVVAAVALLQHLQGLQIDGHHH